MKKKNKKSKWGFGVFALYGVFILFILSLVMYVSLQDIQVVEKDYYKKDLAYQDQIGRIERANQLEKKLTINVSPESGNILINFPVEANKEISGSIKLFRPSNARLDFEIAIDTDSMGVQEIDITSLVSGYWKMKMNWTVDSIGYYQEEPLVIN